MPIIQLKDEGSLIFLVSSDDFTPCCVRRQRFRAAALFDSLFFLVFDEVMNWRDEAELLRDFELSAQNTLRLESLELAAPLLKLPQRVFVKKKTD